MSAIQHHIPDTMITAYATGTMPYAFALVVAAHVSICESCRASLEAHEAVGGAMIENLHEVALSNTLKEKLFAQLNAPCRTPPNPIRKGLYPAPVLEALRGGEPKWKKLGMGVRQALLSKRPSGSVRLLAIPPAQAVPDHGHNGLELTLVLQGSFRDETGRFGVGDVEVADENLEHKPVAGPKQTCICLAATNARLRFRATIPRLLQPVFRI